MKDGLSPFTEDDLVSAIRRLLRDEAPGVWLGPGDDAAVVEFGPHQGIITVDMMVEGVHFRRSTSSPRDLGYKALAVNVSDVAAMGGSPRYAVISLGLPLGVDIAWVVELYGGLRECSAEHAMAVVGGDTSRAGCVIISVAVTGEVANGSAITRSGAGPGDRIVVTGSLGAAAGGLLLSQADPARIGATVSSDWGRSLLAAQARPVARVGEGQTLAQSGATAMMDLSDGLAKDLSRLCRESGVGAEVMLQDLPVAVELTRLTELMEVDPLRLALSGGDDYELLAALPASAVEETARRLRERFGTPLADIGTFTPGKGLTTIDTNGLERPLEPQGWDHFGG